MSRTDKDRPWWVVNFQDDGYIDHDHTSGVCIMQTLEHAKFYNGGSGYRPHHDCKKIVRVDFECFPRKVNGKRQIVLSVEVPPSRYFGRGYNDVNRRQGCWVRTCDCGHAPTDYIERMYCDKKYNTRCFGHYYTYRDNSIPCDCDTWPEKATCSPTAYDTRGGYHRYTWGGVPTEFVRAVYHRPERHRASQRLNDMAREYNHNGEIEDGDYFNRQARNSARWLWW